jgi:peptidylprolyl isomerase
MNMETIKNNDSVKVHYTGTLEDGTIFDSSRQDGREPLEAKLGYGMLIKGFEDALIGMSIGETKSISIDPEFAYGNHNQALINEVELTQLPEGVSTGDTLQGMSQNGPIMVTVTEVKETTAVVDANHPLAGKKLLFDLEVVSIN